MIHWTAGCDSLDGWQGFIGQLAVLWRAVGMLSWAAGSALAGGWQAAFCGSLSGFRRICLLAEDRFDFQALRGYAFCKNI